MKKLALLAIATVFTAAVFAQEAPKAPAKPEMKKEAGAEKGAKKHHGGKHHKKEKEAAK